MNHDLAMLAAGGGVPLLDRLTNIVQGIYAVIEDVKVYRQECKDLSYRCRELLLALRDSAVGLEGTRAIQMADEAELTVNKVLTRLQEWAALNRVRSFLQHADVKQGIDQCHSEIDACIIKFNIALNLDLSRGQKDLAAVAERDKAELRDMLQTIAKSMDDLRFILTKATPHAVEGIMQSFQEELHNPGLAAAAEQTFKRGLWVLHEQTDLLPPNIDLTGQVSRISEHPVAYGAFNDIYTGQWLESETVALRLPRALANAPGAQERFQMEVRIWRKLKHPNVVPLYGIIHVGERVYSVSPWMEYGSALEYLTLHPDADRLQLLLEVVDGMEYLHQNNVVHGDLRGSNVLISKDRIAKLSDFGLSKFLEDGGHGISCPAGVNPRWFAPEIIEQTSQVSKHADVWSFGMLALEVMTGEQPFSYIPRDIGVMFDITNGNLPEHPGDLAKERGLSDELWDLMSRCWQHTPALRPTIIQIKRELTQIQVTRDNAPSPAMPPLIVRTETVASGNSHISRTGNLPSPSTSGGSSKKSRPGSNSSSLVDGKFDPRRLSIFSSEGSEQVESPTEMSSSPNLPRMPTKTWKSRLKLRLNTPVTRGTTPIFESLERPTPIRQSTDATITSETPPTRPVRQGKATFFPQSRSNMESGTLDELVDRLITESSDVTRDSSFQDIFLATYLSFTDCRTLFLRLCYRFELTGTSIEPPEVRATRRFSILAFMKRWVSSQVARVDLQVLKAEVREFAKSVKSSPTMKRHAQELGNLIDERIRQQELLIQPEFPRVSVMPRASSITARDIAVALTVLEGEAHARLRPADYIIHLNQLGISNNVETALVMNKRVNYWVKRALLRPDKIESRVEALKFFVNAADECRQLHNFSSMAAIVKALGSTPIVRLRATRRDLNEGLNVVLQRTNKLIEPDENYKAYRKALKKTRDSCIPWITIHVNDLEVIHTSSPAITDVKGEELINFVRCIDLANQLQDVSALKPPDVRHEHDLGKLAYLKDQLQNVRIDAQADDEIEARSHDLGIAEQRIHELRLRELRALGFRN